MCGWPGTVSFPSLMSLMLKLCEFSESPYSGVFTYVAHWHSDLMDTQKNGSGDYILFAYDDPLEENLPIIICGVSFFTVCASASLGSWCFMMYFLQRYIQTEDIILLSINVELKALSECMVTQRYDTFGRVDGTDYRAFRFSRGESLLSFPTQLGL